MGYESQLVIVEAPTRDQETDVPFQVYDGDAFCSFLATFELGKMGYQNPFADLVQRSIKAEKERIEQDGWRYSFFETAEGNTQIATDKYDDPVAPLDLDELIEAIRSEMSINNHVYRRLPYTLAALESMQAGVKAGLWPNGLVVLHYGH